MAHFSGTKENNCQPRAEYSRERCFRNEGEIKTFPDEGTLRELVTSKPKKMQKDICSLRANETIKEVILEHQKKEGT